MEDLKRALASQSVVFLLGAGASASIAEEQSTATWIGLIKSGIVKAKQINRECDDRWEEIVNQLLTYALETNSTDLLVQTAGMVKLAIEDMGDQAFANWINEDIGTLTPVNRDLAVALLSFPFPILTTNYDTLLEKVGGRRSAVWKRAKGMQELLLGHKDDIGHLHGVWEEPDTLILSQLDYASLLASESTLELEKSVLGMKTLVIIGFGSGLDDPNLSNLLKWYRRVFSNSAITHFRLCRADELDNLRQVHAGDSIKPISYGSQFSDLPDFLKSCMPPTHSITLTAAGIARDVVGDLQQAWIDHLKSDSVIAEIVGEEGHSPDDLLVPPVLLPVPYSDYVKAKKSRHSKDRIERLDPVQETMGADVLIVVGEEGAGLSTAIRWLAYKALGHLDGAIPIYVNFKNCRTGKRSIRNQIRNYAKEHGLLAKKNSVLPSYILVLDDLSPYVKDVSEDVVEFLGANEAIFTIIGCKRGNEEDIQTQLKRIGLDPKVRYLGQLDSEDVKMLAKFTSAGSHKKLAERVINVLRSENFTRTPFTASLLISIYHRGGVVNYSASETTIVESYVSNLLGRGDPHEDSRFVTDQIGRELVLSHLAKYFVESFTSGISEADLLNLFSEIFKSVGWEESPTLMLEHFLALRVLRKEGSFIQFGRNSFLFLFAAKWAQTDEEFLQRISEKPLFYPEILKDYAALTRNDEKLLSKVNSLLDGIRDQILDKGSPYEKLELTAIPDVGQAELEKYSIQVLENSELREESLSELSSLDRVEDERPAFPSENPDELPFTIRLARALSLVSSILRDSDQIVNLDLKKEVLVRVLDSWGLFISALNSDKVFLEMITGLTEEIIRILDEEEPNVLDSQEQEELKQHILRSIPAVISLGGIDGTLASKKLVSSFNEVLEEGQFVDSEESAIAAIFFLFVVKPDKWAKQVRQILNDHQKNSWIISIYIFNLLTDTYVNVAQEDSREDPDLLELCMMLLERKNEFASPQTRVEFLNVNRQNLQTSRLQRRLAIRNQPPELL